MVKEGERERAARENGEGGSDLLIRKGLGRVWLMEYKGDFGYLKPNLAIVYSF